MVDFAKGLFLQPQRVRVRRACAAPAARTASLSNRWLGCAMRLVDAADSLAWLSELMEQVVQIDGDLVLLYFGRD